MIGIMAHAPLLFKTYLKVVPDYAHEGGKIFDVTIPNGYSLASDTPLGVYVSGDYSVYPTDRSVKATGRTAVVEIYVGASKQKNIRVSFTLAFIRSDLT